MTGSHSPVVSAALPPLPFKHLRVGERYQVVVPFTDYDGDHHPEGEAWTFLTHNFVPYHDGLSLFVTPDGNEKRQIRLQWTPEEQGEVIDGLENYLRPIGPSQSGEQS